jgi:hypothetical protein
MWERNYFGDLRPWLHAIMDNMYVRGAVTGVGLVTAWAGLRDLLSVVSGRRASKGFADPPAR